MNQEQLTRLLAAREDQNPRSPPCPDEHRVAGYVDGGLDPAARREVEVHLADCSHCVALVALLARECGTDAAGSVDNEVVTPVATRAPQRRWFSAPQWAAAAAMILAVPLLFSVINRPVEEGRGSPTPPATRTLTPPGIGLQVLPPTAGSAADRRLAFRWTEVADTPFYDLRIVTDDGDVVIRQRVTGTTWTAPAQLRLQPGAEYFVHVEAYPSGDKGVSSDHVPFEVPD